MVKSKRMLQPVVLQDIFVSIVIALKEDTEDVVSYVKRMSGLLASTYTNYEIIVIDNGIDLMVMQQITADLLQLPCIRIIRLSQKFNHDAALFAGLEVSIGDYVCTVDPSIDPVEEIVTFVEKNKTKDVVQGYSKVPIKGTVLGQAGRRLFYWYNRKYIAIDIPLDATFLASYSRRAVNSLTQTTRSQKHLRHMARRVGYSYELVGYTPSQNVNRHKNVKTGFFEAFEIIVSYSTHPLRFVSFLGVIAGIFNFLYTIYIVLQNIFNSHLAEGWTTTSLQLSIMFFILFIILVVISEYIGRILVESQRDPHYYVSDELVSTTPLANADRRNITE